MPVGLEIINSSGNYLFDANSAALHFVRKVQGTSAPALKENEVVAIKAPNWTVSGASKTYYVFDTNPTSASYGFEVRDENGAVVFNISEGYADIVGSHLVSGIKTDGSVESYESYPAGDYAILYPRTRAVSVNSGGMFYTHIEKYRTTTRGFQRSAESIGTPVPIPGIGPAYGPERILVIDVAGL